MIDLYCERTGPGFWAEPVNALTNLAFPVAAWASWRMIHRSGTGSTGLSFLIALVVSIGIGSFLFHTFATRWAQVLDVVPILLFQISYLWLYARRVIWTNRMAAVGMLGAFAIAALIGERLHAILNGSLIHAPAFLVLIGLGAYHFLRRKQEPFAVLAASVVFLLSLFFRSIDLAVCPYVPVGTHFVWHILNGVVLYLVVRALVHNWPKPEPLTVTVKRGSLGPPE